MAPLGVRGTTDSLFLLVFVRCQEGLHLCFQRFIAGNIVAST